MLARRIERDTKERGRDVDGILSQYLRYVKPAYDNFVLPSFIASHKASIQNEKLGCLTDEPRQVLGRK